MPGHVAAASTPWPTNAVIPGEGAYRVDTTWREVIDAAISVGREPTAWLAAVPALAWSEIIARRSPLAAYLGRARLDPSSGTGYCVEPNVVYTDGTENSARHAFGYRIGMTMAEWACRGLMGLGPTVHAESGTPAGAGPAWHSALGLPDLVGAHPVTGVPWLIEAKGGRRLGRGPLKKGAQQLCRPGMMTGPHVKLLCGTSLTDRLFMTIDVEKHERQAQLSVASPDPLLALAQSRMLVYLALRALPSSSLRVLPVGFGVTDRGGRRGGAGTVTLLEEDASTRNERNNARQEGRYRSRPGRERLDMLTGPVPGTDLIIGISRRLYGACDALARVQAEMASTINAEYPRPSLDQDDEDLERLRDDRINRYWDLERSLRSAATETASQGASRGEERRWEELYGGPLEFSSDPAPGYVEAATPDTYLAVDARAVRASQPRSS